MAIDFTLTPEQRELSLAARDFARKVLTEVGPATRHLATAEQQAWGNLYGMVQRQASMVAFVGIFQLMGIVFLALTPLVLLMKRPKSRSAAVGAH